MPPSLEAEAREKARGASLAACALLRTCLRVQQPVRSTSARADHCVFAQARLDAVHQEKLRSMKSSVDTSSPATYSHLGPGSGKAAVLANGAPRH